MSITINNNLFLHLFRREELKSKINFWLFFLFSFSCAHPKVKKSTQQAKIEKKKDTDPGLDLVAGMLQDIYSLNIIVEQNNSSYQPFYRYIAYEIS